ncbi:MAG: CHRD domain-containing protein [Ferruginibacter sp.]
MKLKFTFLLSLVLLICTVNGQMRYLKGILQASQEGATVISPATGVVIVQYNMATKFLVLYGNYKNLTTPANNAHIHGPAAPGATASPMVFLTFSTATIGMLGGTATLTAAQETALLGGNTYVNVHTATYPNGEVRAQLTTTTDLQTEFFSARLQGAQQTPPNASPATGMAYAIIDKATDSLFLTGSYSGLPTPATNAHIHSGAPHVAGAVIVPLKFTNTSSGTLDTAQLVTTSVKNSLLSGDTYVNVHTATFPGGEIRGQLTQLSQMVFFGNALTGAQQVPPNSSTARGTVIVKYNSETNFLELAGDYQNLAAPATAAHIHGPVGPAGTNANVLFTLTASGGVTGTLTGTATLTDPQEVELLSGNMYVNVHNTVFPGGEIRAQLLSTAMGASQYFSGKFDPDQSVPVPANPTSTATGTTKVLLDKITNQVFVTGDFTGLTSNISNAHIHRGIAGTNGPVAIPLFFAGTTAGTVTGTATISNGLADSMVKGWTYLNIHSELFGGGEIRAQLGDLVLPVKLKLFNGFKEQNKIKLVWQSEEEINLDHYEIEQQDIAGSRWILKGTIAVANNTSGSNYSIIDIPFTGSTSYVFYRIRMVDKDGKFTYSNIIKINYLKANAELMLLSNPIVNGDLKFVVTGLPVDKKAAVSVLDFNGRVVARKLVSTLTDNLINLRNVSAGVYQLMVRIDDTILHQTFVK